MNEDEEGHEGRACTNPRITRSTADDGLTHAGIRTGSLHVNGSPFRPHTLQLCTPPYLPGTAGLRQLVLKGQLLVVGVGGEREG